jgi:hypothetical protein
MRGAMEGKKPFIIIKKNRTTHQRNRKIGRKNSASQLENFLSALLLLLHRSSWNREEQKLSKVNSESSGKQTRLGSDGKSGRGRRGEDDPTTAQ